jgi:hypothetical protein
MVIIQASEKVDSLKKSNSFRNIDRHIFILA